MRTVSTRPGLLLRWLAGPIIWASHFLVVYASESLVCSRGGGPGSHAWVMGVATIAALGALAAVIALALRRTHSSRKAQTRSGAAFMDAVAVTLGFLSAAAVIATVLPAFLISACRGVG